MPAAEARERLRGLTSTILDPGRPGWSLRNEVLEAARLLESFSTITRDPHEQIGGGETRADDGLAIAPTMAIMCADDYCRTVIFIRALHAAISEARAQRPNEPVRVLYAGCGPLAMLAAPLAAIRAAHEFKVTALDIHEESIHSAQQIIEAVAPDPTNFEFTVADACRYEIPAGQTPHVIATETMNTCLENEPQVAITRRLLAQAPDASLVPESVRVDAYLVDVAREFSLGDAADPRAPSEPVRDRVFLGTAFELSAEIARTWAGSEVDCLPGMRVQLPVHIEPKYQPMLLTRIRAYAEHRLGDYESGLTCPRAFPTTVPLVEGRALQFSYRLGPRPGLEFAVIG